MSDNQESVGWVNKIWNRPETVEERITLSRSRVRTLVTHGAAWFLFLGGGLLIGYLVIWGCDAPVAGNGSVTTNRTGCEQGVDLFQTIIPVAASIVTFWFAGRVHERKGNGDDVEGKVQ